jgi:hypothetical protein
VAANGRNGPVASESSGFERKLVRWCRIRPVVSDWYVGFFVGFSESKMVACGFASEARLDGNATSHWRLTT